ncbi:MAG TPA: ABC transporter permease [Candidatus Saccharimonadales bacterium]
MGASLKSELRKLFSVRSTYILLGLALVYMAFYDFFIVGFRANAKHHGDFFVNYHSHYYIFSEVARSGGISPPILFCSIVAVLLMAHEYRYNTIMYTLTASNSRSKTLLAKFLAVTGFAILFALFVEILSPSLAVLGMHVHHLSTTGQVFFYKQFFVRVLFYSWAYSTIGLLLAIFFRNLVAAIAALFLLPVAIEPLISLLLTTNQQQYLPFNAMTAVIDNGILQPGANQLSALRSALVVIVYLVVFWLIAWFSFLKRDAN